MEHLKTMCQQNAGFFCEFILTIHKVTTISRTKHYAMKAHTGVEV